MMNTKTEFEIVAKTAQSMKNAERSAISVASVSGKTLIVFGWSFGIADLREFCDNNLKAWRKEVRNVSRVSTDIIYTSYDYIIKLNMMT